MRRGSERIAGRMYAQAEGSIGSILNRRCEERLPDPRPRSCSSFPQRRGATALVTPTWCGMGMALRNSVGATVTGASCASRRCVA